MGNSNVHRVIYETFRANDTKFYKVIEISPVCDLVNVKEKGRGGNEQSRRGAKWLSLIENVFDLYNFEQKLNSQVQTVKRVEEAKIA